jgi:hypothetical protein
MTLKNSGIQNPVLIDIVSGVISNLHWKEGTTDTLDTLPLRDSVFAIADAGYFDWPVLPEAPSGLAATSSNSGVRLQWDVHGGNPDKLAIERRTGNTGIWTRIATIATGNSFTDNSGPRGSVLCYRVRALDSAGESAYSNVARCNR